MEDLSENETVMRVRVLPLYSLLGTAQVSPFFAVAWRSESSSQIQMIGAVTSNRAASTKMTIIVIIIRCLPLPKYHANLGSRVSVALH